MGFVKQVVGKLTGADVAADATERAADQQASAIRDSAAKAASQAQEAAAQSARQQESAAARNAAEGAAADAMNKPIQNADIQLDGINTEQSASATSRKRRQQFGVGSAGSGVNI
jgi:hypothetical protein